MKERELENLDSLLLRPLPPLPCVLPISLSISSFLFTIYV